MKFLVDAQLPKSLSELLKQFGHDALHTLELPSMNATSDQFIIDLATAEQRIVVSKDAVFFRIIYHFGKTTQADNCQNRKCFE